MFKINILTNDYSFLVSFAYFTDASIEVVTDDFTNFNLLYQTDTACDLANDSLMNIITNCKNIQVKKGEKNEN